MSEATSATPQGRQTDLRSFFTDMRACQDEPAIHRFVSGAFQLTWERRIIEDEENDEFTLYEEQPGSKQRFCNHTALREDDELEEDIILAFAACIAPETSPEAIIGTVV